MTYIGSWKVDDLLTFYCNTQVFATGVATDADSAPSYRVYEDETTTPLLTGSMALIDSANTAGYYSEQITLSAANGFEKGKCYSIYIAATVSSVAGATHRTFQMEAEVDANRINWANVDNPTTTLGLSNTTVGIITTYTGNTPQTGDSFARIGVAGAGLTNIDLPNQTMDIVGNITGNLSGSVGSVTGAVGSVTAGVTLAASAVQAIWDALTSALTTVGSIGKLLVDNINATITSRMATYTQPTGFLAATFPSGTVANTTNITAGTMTTTTNLTTNNDKTGYALTSAYDYAKGTVAMTESYAAQGAEMTPIQAHYQAVQHLGESGIASTTKTVKKRDGSTTAKTFTLDSSVTPTSITETT